MCAAPRAAERVRFGRFELDLRTEELRRDGQIVNLPPKPSRALVLLVRHAGALVTREEFHAAVWHGAIMELDPGLNTCIRGLRAALGDSAEAPTFIETVPRRGYRFVAHVEPAPRDSATPRWARAAAAIALGSVLVWAAPRARPGLPDDPRPIRLAVLPLEPLSADAADLRFADGLHEELLTAIGGADPRRLRLLARSSSTRIAGELTLAEMRDRFAIDYVVQGRVRREPGGYKITTQLVDTETATTHWSGETRLSAETPSISAQERLASQIVRAIAGAFDLDLAAPRTVQPPTEVVQAWLVARHLAAQRTTTARVQALDLLGQVVATDATFVPAHAALVRLLVDLSRHDEAEQALSRAADHLESSPALRLERGRLRLRQWRLREAGEDLAAAAEGSPHDARAQHAYGYYLSVTGQHAEALRAMEAARALDPVSESVVGDAGLFAYWAGAPDEAIERCQEIQPYALPEFRLMLHRCLFHSYVALEAWGEAKDQARLILDGVGASATDRAPLEAALTPRAAIAAYFSWAAEPTNLVSSQGGAGSYRSALAAAGAGDVDGALAALERALEEREPRLIEINVEPRLDSLRGEARFEAIARAVGIPTPSTEPD